MTTPTPTPTPGFHRMTDAAYFGIDLPSSSATKVLIDGTNAHLAHEREHPREETEALAIGSYLHALVLAPETIDDAFVRVGKIDRRTKEGKAEWETAQRRASTNGSRIITEDQVAVAEAMAASVQQHRAASTLLRHATDREIVVIGEIGGRPAKAKLDALLNSTDENGTPITIIADLKSAASASPREFSSSAAKFAYFHQAAWYSRLVNQFREVHDFVYIAVEKDPPHLCAVYRVSGEDIAAADARLEELAARWWEVARGDRTGYDPGIVQLVPPTWWRT